MSLDAKLLDVIAEYPRLRAGLVHLGHPMVLDETLHRLQSQGLVDQDPITRLWSRTSTPAPESAGAPAAVTEHVEAAGMGGSLWTTPAVPGAGGLPGAKIPGLEDEIRILTLDDVAEPAPFHPTAEQLAWARSLPSPEGAEPPPPRGHPAHGVGPSWSDRIAALEEALRLADKAIAGLTARLHRLERPEPVGPVMTPPGIHVEAKREREAVVEVLESVPDSSWETNEDRQLFQRLITSIELGQHRPKGER